MQIEPSPHNSLCTTYTKCLVLFSLFFFLISVLFRFLIILNACRNQPFNLYAITLVWVRISSYLSTYVFLTQSLFLFFRSRVSDESDSLFLHSIVGYFTMCIMVVVVVTMIAMMMLMMITFFLHCCYNQLQTVFYLHIPMKIILETFLSHSKPDGYNKCHTTVQAISTKSECIDTIRRKRFVDGCVI